MAVPGSGELSLLKIAKEKLYGNYDSASTVTGPISLKDVSQGGNASGSGTSFDATNVESPNFPDNVAGFGMEEFFSYDHDFQPIACNKAMDVVFLLDYTYSMLNDMNTLKSNVASISSKVVERSGGDYRLAAVLIDQATSQPSYWSNGTVVAQLNAANRYNSGTVYLAAMIPFASANKSDFDTKISYLNQSTNSATSMVMGSGVGGPEPNDVAIDRVLNHNLAGSFRTGVNRMVILITDNSPDGDGDDVFNGAEEYAKMGTLSNQAVANTTTISVIGSFSNSTSSDGTTTMYDIYNGYANNTGGSTNFSGSPANVNTFIDNICNDIEQNFPSVTTNDPTSISSSGFTMNGNVTAQGGSAVSTRGFAKSSSAIDLFPGVSGVTTHTSGSGTGTFSFNLTGQTSATTYYYRAYAINSTGSSFGEIKSATTTSSAYYIQFYIGEGTAIPPNSEPDTGANITVTITNVLQSGGGTASQTYSVNGSGGYNDVQPLLQFRSGDEITITVEGYVSHPNTDEDFYFDCYDSIFNNIGTGVYQNVTGIRYVHTLTMPSEDLSCDIYLSSTWL